MIFATANKHKLREMRELLPELELKALPDGVELPPEEGDSFAVDRAGEGPRRARGERRGRDRRRLGNRGDGARRPAGDPLRSLRRSRARATRRTSTSSCARSRPPGDERRAAYHCALALVEADGSERVFEARCEGRLIERPRGEGGFGYDPAFVPDDTGPDDERTMSELSQAEKNEISHRGRAARLLAAHLDGGRVSQEAR